MKILHVVGARPNFMKAAPVLDALSKASVDQLLVHTGQHYDVNMSDVFFQELGIREPEVNLQVGSGSHAEQTAEIMVRIEPVLVQHRPDFLVVYGDVNSTIASALVAAKLGIRIVHVEAGLRSFDNSMPEEINRVLTDRIADVLLTPSIDGNENLLHEGVSPDRIMLVGNVMIDSLVRLLPLASERIPDDLPDRYALVTLHRPSNVDAEEVLREIYATLIRISHDIDVVFPVHPRTRQRLSQLGGARDRSARLHLLDPKGYLEFLAMQQKATVVITDSGGIQEETTYLGVPCLTVRNNTERPVTTTIGTNTLVGTDMKMLEEEVRAILAGKRKKGRIPPLWDGKAAIRIADLLARKSP